MNEKTHFIGIGGIGMGTLANLLLVRGDRVSGSDLRTNTMTLRLQELGADVYEGHQKENIDGASTVVYSSAVSLANPELIAAQKQGCRILRRAELLAELMQGHIAVTVAGAHGKTTTSTMIAELLVKAGLDPTVALGGVIKETTMSATLGKGTYFVAELDESDGSFLNFYPNYSVITNIDFEHVDYYQHWEAILKAYQQFLIQTQDNGIIIAYGEDARLQELCAQVDRQLCRYGFSQHCDVVARNLKFHAGGSTFDCSIRNKHMGTVNLNVPGRYNIANALAAITVGWLLDIEFSFMASVLAHHRGVKRRFHQKGCVNDITVVDDYAHHPTEIRHTLEAARQVTQGRLVVIFQPHRYTRLQALLDDFARSLSAADEIYIAELYAASEAPIAGVNSQVLVDKINELAGGRAAYVVKEKILKTIIPVVKPGDMVLTLGAGDITYYADALFQQLKKMATLPRKKTEELCP